ncbi:hypothetical protein [Hyalangium sp.]|uniref:hypothetical protein n=1 Tax=Hyalangium sp. TaxID=2028555 RepID=UPI002D5C5319|nr:hypothetical protein [Hyalangium sp.]HYH98066.1 hypothetical protein [Hyalangium sp.]
MQLLKTMMMLIALSAMSLVMTGCPTDEEGSLTCALDADCIEGEICHPNAKVCVKTCTAGADCPSSAKTCAALSTADNRQVCQCATDTLCNSEGTTDLVCSNLDKVCATKCTTDASCGTGRTCDTATGQCKAGGVVGDTCTGEGQSTCTYGTQFCSASKCTALPTPSCQNYTNFANKSELGTTGVIIYSARVESAATDTAFCGNTDTKRVKIAISAYSDRAFPATKAELSGFFYILVDGEKKDAIAAVSSSSGNYTVSGTNRERAEIVVSLCRPPSSTTTSTGFYFTSGNFFCYQANYL